MPEIRHYRVTQTREIDVSANSLVDAVLLGSAAFENGVRPVDKDINKRPSGVWGNADTLIKETDINARRL